MVIRKKNEKPRVCTDFIDFNNACPKDNFPLLMIDTMVDATTCHELLSFLDTHSRYNQILVYSDDQEKISL